MIFICTDFGHGGPYHGQMELAIRRQAPGVKVIHLMADLPRFAIRESAYLVAALCADLPEGSVCIGVVDPGVGTERKPLAVFSNGIWLIGPDNGLFEIACRRDTSTQVHEILYRPESLSDSFHGRDLFAPVAARLASGEEVAMQANVEFSGLSRDWPEDLNAIVYIDDFGNAMTGIRADILRDHDTVLAAGHTLGYHRVFGLADAQQPFWYRNSLGLVELALNRGSAAALLGLAIGDAIQVAEAKD